jgi:outer membrane receptor protein involved in Fe transport
LNVLNRKLVRIGILFVSFLGSAWAQRDLATLTGTVTDSTGSVVPGAKVTMTEVATGLAYSVTTEQTGTYVRPALKPGIYNVEVEAQGFKKALQKDVLLTAGERVGVSITLEVGDTTQSVDVLAEAAMLQTESTSIGQGLNSRSVADLPLGGQRKVAFLARLSVGVVVDEAGIPGAVGGGFSAAGVPSMGTSNYLLNGVDNNINNIDMQGLAAYVVSLPPDAVGEVQVLANGYNAEYGRGGGGVMEVTMKSGTNQLHGAVYEFLQNDKLNANSWDANKAGFKKGPWKQNEFGAAVGGPIIKNRTFWFANYEGLRFRSFGNAVPGAFSGAATIYTVPTPAMVKGDFSGLLLNNKLGTDPLGNPVSTGMIYDFNTTTPDGKGGYTRVPFTGNIIPRTMMDPVAMKVLGDLPAPNQNLGSRIPGSNFFAAARAVQDNDQGHLRIDHRITDKDQLFGSLSLSSGSLLNPPALSQANSGALAPGYDLNSLARFGMLSYTRIWTPQIISETRVAYNRSVQIRTDSDGLVDNYKTYGIPGYDPFTTAARGGLPTLAITNYSSLGGPGFNPSDEYSMVYDFIQNVAVNRGTHAMKFGAEYKPVSLPMYQPAVPHGRMTFSQNFTNNPQSAFSANTGDAVASFLLGYPSAFALSSSNFTYQRHYSLGFFAQDDWKATRNLTLNLGLRYELFSPFYDNSTGQGNVVPGPNGTWIYEVAAGKNQNVPFSAGETAFLTGAGVPVMVGQVNKYGGVHFDKMDFGPRFGLAYKFRTRNVLRAAYGIYYTGEQNRGGFVPLDENPPYNEDINYTGATYTLNPYVTRLSNGFPLNIYNLAIPSSRNLHGVAPDLDNPRVMKWNVALQRELPHDTALELSYLGNSMSHLFVVWDPTMPPDSPNVLVSTASLNSLRANPALGGFPNYLSSFGFGNYNALGVKIEKRLSKGLQFTAAYTWGHALAAAPTGSYAQGNVAAPSARDMSSIYASSPWDIRQNFVASAIYDLPFGKGKAFGDNWNPLLNGVLGGWQVNGLYTWHTGHVVTLNTTLGVGYLGYRSGASYYYASVLPGKSSDAAPPGGRTPSEWFDVNNIVAPAPYTQGNLNNATNTLPSITNVDLSLFKEFPIRERYKLTFRAEVFNLTNTPAFASMGTTLGVGGFGSLLTTNLGSNRRFQMAAKLTF